MYWVLFLPVKEVSYMSANVLKVNTAVSYLPFSSNLPSSTIMFWESRYYVLKRGKGGGYHLSLIFVSGYEPWGFFFFSTLSLKADLPSLTPKKESLGVSVTTLIYTPPSQRSKLSGRT